MNHLPLQSWQPRVQPTPEFVEKQKLKHVVIGWIDPTISDGGFDADIIGHGFDNAGVHGYNNLVMLQPDDICYLNVSGTYIPIVKAHKLTAAVAFHHTRCHKRLNVCSILEQ